jgi:Uma2 family endonuclease
MHMPLKRAAVPQDVIDGIDYPYSDGKPLAENTKQLEWILLLTGNLKALFEHRDDVFVSSDQLWYPVKGRPDLCYAPDVYVVFGRPKGDRLSWKQWQENDTPLTVVIEILSPGNSLDEAGNKLEFYGEYGVEEYYTYEPYEHRFMVYTRGQILLRRERCPEDRFTSPRLGVHFDWSGDTLQVTYPDGRPFLTLYEMDQLRLKEMQARERAEHERERAERERDTERRERQRLEAERDAERQTRQSLEQRLLRLAELGQRLAAGEATTEELAEFQRLLAERQG